MDCNLCRVMWYHTCLTLLPFFWDYMHLDTWMGSFGRVESFDKSLSIYEAMSTIFSITSVLVSFTKQKKYNWYFITKEQSMLKLCRKDGLISPMTLRGSYV